MKGIELNKVTSIIFSNEDGQKLRFVLTPHREAMETMEDKMDEHGCEPLLVVDSGDPGVWWTDDTAFVVGTLGFDGDMDAHVWAEMVAESDTWWIYDEGMVYRDEDGNTIRAEISTMPCDEAHGQCTDDCEPIDL